MGATMTTPTSPRRPWARSAIERADELSIPADLYHVAALHCGCWWMKNERGQCSPPDGLRIEVWLRQLGVVSALQHALIPPVSTTGPDRSSAPPDDVDSAAVERETTDDLTPARQADIARVRAIVEDNSERLRERYGKWLFGDVLQLLWESMPARRVIKERGILLVDIRTGILRASRSDTRMFPESMVVGMAIGELKRLHKGRLAFLFVDAPAGHPARLIANENATRRSHPRVTRRRETDDLAVGRIAWVAVEEHDQGMRSTKRHPAVLLARTGRRSDRWVILTMTSEVPGEPESRRVPDAAGLGLDYGGFLWETTSKVYKSQVDRVVGWVHRDLVHAIDRTIGLRQALRDELLSIADEHHPQ